MSLPSGTTAEKTGSVAALQMRLLGPFEVRLQGEPLPPLRTRKGAWLLALLVLRHDRPVERTWLAGTLWPESGHREALKNLRESLYDLRRALGSQASRLASPTPSTLCLKLEEAEVDLLAFDAAVARGAAALTQAIQLYRGPLLEGCTEEWVVAEREQREQAYLNALEAAADVERQQGSTASAAQRLRTCLGIDPWRERAQRALMAALEASGNSAGAMQVYREFRLRLHEEMHAQPAEETTALFHQIRNRVRRAAVISVAPCPRPIPSLASRHPLPVPLSPLIGRRAELEEIRSRLEVSRLVTLVGVGGIGKTRLALQTAAEREAEYAEGAVFVDLAPLGDPSLLPNTVAEALQIGEQPERSHLETLKDYVRSAQVLLILDNCEHLLEACAQLADTLLGQGPHLKVLATSRQALGLTGEAVYRVPGLSVPQSETSTPDKDGQDLLMASEAMQLFVERAFQAEPSFVLTAQNAAAAAGICRELEGIPLAIELATSRLKALSAPEIQARLGDRLRLLRGGSRAASARQQTLRATLDWSYDLLSAPERILLGRLSVFRGGWTLEAAESVCCDLGVENSIGSEASHAGMQYPSTSTSLENRRSNLESGEILDLLSSLVDKSLVLYAGQEAGARYRLLETVRQYAWERMREREEEGSIGGRHRDYFLALAEEIQPKLSGADQAHWLKVLDNEHDNLRQAIAFSLEEPEGAEAGLRLGAALWLFWDVRSYFREGRAYLGEVLGREGASGPTRERAKALHGAGVLAYGEADYAAARALFKESLAIRWELGDKHGIAQSLDSLGIVTQNQDYATARMLFEQSLAIRREAGDKHGIAQSLFNLGGVAHIQSDIVRARTLFEECLAIRRELGDKHGIAQSLNVLGVLTQQQGDYAAARKLHEQCLTIARELGDRRDIARSLVFLGLVARAQCDFAAARALYEESLAICRELGDKHGIVQSLNFLGFLAQQQGDYAAARALHEQCLAICRELGMWRGMAHTLNNLGLVAREQGDYAAARAFHEQSLAIDRERSGDKWGIANSLHSLGLVAQQQGDYTAARALHEQCLAIRREMGDRGGIAICLNSLGRLAYEEGHYREAYASLAECLRPLQELGDKWDAVRALENFARLASAQEQPERATRLWGAAKALREAINSPLPPNEREEYDRDLAVVRLALGEEVFAAVWAEGRAMTLEQAMRFALSEAWT
jgi:predicted ATPase/DNA-binding SARP family transcriptional activator